MQDPTSKDPATTEKSRRLGVVKRLLAGAVALAAGTVALIEAHSHRPLGPPVNQPDPAKLFAGENVIGYLSLYKKVDVWSVTAYDAVHIAGVVLISLGGAALIVGLATIARRLLTS